MSGFVLKAMSAVGNFDCWGLRQLAHAVEVNRSGPWLYPNLLSKVACLAAGYLAYDAPSNDLKKAYIACSLASLAANYAFRQVWLSDLNLESNAVDLDRLKEAKTVIANLHKELKGKNRLSNGSQEKLLELGRTIERLQNELTERKESETGTAELNKILIGNNGDLTKQCQSLTQDNDKLTQEKEDLAKALEEAKSALPEALLAATSADPHDDQNYPFNN